MTKVLVELLTTHTHGGRRYSAGAQIMVNKDQAQWLIARAVAKIPDDKQKEK
ncbi:MAG: hypothetical protein LBP58_01190 [Azoarcus sp.]|jgi:hypothetical protein|nr:hypothetical protein [Azoarcus sp.]